jgi:hypothetical protein
MQARRVADIKPNLLIDISDLQGPYRLNEQDKFKSAVGSELASISPQQYLQ